jgi:hypothetical protein
MCRVRVRRTPPGDPGRMASAVTANGSIEVFKGREDGCERGIADVAERRMNKPRSNVKRRFFIII